MTSRVVAAVSALLVVAGWAAPAAADHGASVRIFPTAPQLTRDEEPVWRFGYLVRTEVRGAERCDAWRVDVSGAGFESFTSTGTGTEERRFEGTVAATGLVELNATATCAIAGHDGTGSAEPTYVEGPREPTSTPPMTPLELLTPEVVRDLARIGRHDTALALLSCAPRRRLARAARPLRPLLRLVCSASTTGALASLHPPAPPSGYGEGPLPRPPSASVRSISMPRICPRRKRARRCSALRRTAIAYVQASRWTAALTVAMQRAAIAFQANDDAPPTLTASAVERAYAGELADALAARARASRALAGALVRVGLDRRLGRAGLRAQELAWPSQPVVRRTSAELRADARQAARLLVGNRFDAAGGKPVGLVRTLRRPPAARALAAFGGSTTLEMFIELVRSIADEADPGGAAAPLQLSIARLAKLCEPSDRAAAYGELASSARAYAGSHAIVVRRAAVALSAPPTDRPRGCPAPLAPTGPYLEFGTFGAAPGQFDRPTDVTAGPGGIYVADQRNSRVQRFTREGALVGAWGRRPASGTPPAAGEFIEPVGVATSAGGDVYVTDFRANRVQQFTAEGAFVREWGGPGTGPGQLDRPGGITVAPDGTVLVVDIGNARIQRFTAVGGFLAAWGTVGSGPGQFRAPRGITTDAAGNVYVAERDNGRVQTYAPDGTLLREWGQRGLVDGQFNGLYDVAIAPNGDVWTADLYGYRLQRFSPDGRLVAKEERFGPGAQSFNPFAVATDGADVLVADINGGSGDRILVFKSRG